MTTTSFVGTDPARHPRSHALLVDMASEFPDFALVYKRTSRLQRAIHLTLALLTFGGQRVYMTKYYTVLFGKLWLPDAWDVLSDVDRVILLRHERVHLRQRRRMGDVVMGFVYLVPFFPLFLAYGRARIEWEAYEETIRATYELKGDAAATALRSFLIGRFVGGEYGFMWPFPKVVGGWFDRFLGDLRRSGPGAGSSL